MTRPPPEAGVFELALVLGGTGSAGTYTAGALDFLLEALEAWHTPNPAPPHQLRIPFTAGSSGGAVCAAMLAIMTRRPVPHIHGDYHTLVDDRRHRGNPLWDTWVNQYEVESLLATSDLDSGRELISLLDTALLDRMEAELVRFAEASEAPPPEYFPAPFRLAVTLTNLRGIPYRMGAIGPPGFTGATFLQHDDYARFAVPNGARAADKRDDEFWLVPGGASRPGLVGYEVLARYATASGAVPGVLSARDLIRPLGHYRYRPRVRPMTDAPGYGIEWPQPDWDGVGQRGAASYEFTATDGGLFNDDPVTLAHEALAGLIGTNPRNPDKANRAILLIDPLQQAQKPLLPIRPPLRMVLPSLFSTLVQGARYRTADLSLFGDKRVFSRFHLVPWRHAPRLLGAEAVVGSRLFGLAGFFCREWRVHDFLLGRRNMQNYLRASFTLRGDNALFRQWDADLRARFAVSSQGAPVRIDRNTPCRDYYLPILPDLTKTPLPPPHQVPLGADVPWPRTMPPLDRLRPMMRRRLAAVLREAAHEWRPGWMGRAAGALISRPGACYLQHAVTDALLKELHDADLLPR